MLDDSTLKVRLIADCPRVLCAAPAYIARRGLPMDGAALVADRHDCLNLRFPGAKEFQWTLATPDGPRRFEITPTQLSSLSQHRRLKDPKVRLFTDFMAARIKDEVRRAIDGSTV